VRGLRFFAAGDGAPTGLAAGAGGGLRLVEGAEAIRQSLLTILSTRPGERVMRPDFGCDLDSLAFAPTGPTTNNLARILVRAAIERFEPRVTLEAVDAFADPADPAVLHLVVEYRARLGAGRLDLAVDLEGDRRDEGTAR
jgi:hypothetical protein